jgi:predicted aminopeptidase
VPGCTSLEYYAQAVSGHLEVMWAAVPIEERLREADTPVALREKLQRVLVIREFASRELGLPDNDSYRRYADLGRPYVLWNVFAAPEFSVAPIQSCFPFAGCVSYRGFYSEEAAQRHAAGLARQGDDVYVGGVSAYSTLGWFSDPVLSTFVQFSEPEIARILFHELAHQEAYVKGDTVFNESFAATVEEEGLRRWLVREGTPAQRAAHADARRRRAGRGLSRGDGVCRAHRRRADDGAKPRRVARARRRVRRCPLRDWSHRR